MRLHVLLTYLQCFHSLKLEGLLLRGRSSRLPGGLVGVCGINCIDYVCVELGVLLAGCVLVPLSTHLTPGVWYS